MVSGRNVLAPWYFAYWQILAQKLPCLIAKIVITFHHKSMALIFPWSDGPNSIGTSWIRSSKLSTPSHNFFHAPNSEMMKFKHEINDSHWARSNNHYSSWAYEYWKTLSLNSSTDLLDPMAHITSATIPMIISTIRSIFLMTSAQLIWHLPSWACFSMR